MGWPMDRGDAQYQLRNAGEDAEATHDEYKDWLGMQLNHVLVACRNPGPIRGRQYSRAHALLLGPWAQSLVLRTLQPRLKEPQVAGIYRYMAPQAVGRITEMVAGGAWTRATGWDRGPA